MLSHAGGPFEWARDNPEPLLAGVLLALIFGLEAAACLSLGPWRTGHLGLGVLVGCLGSPVLLLWTGLAIMVSLHMESGLGYETVFVLNAVAMAAVAFGSTPMALACALGAATVVANMPDLSEPETKVASAAWLHTFNFVAPGIPFGTAARLAVELVRSKRGWASRS